jgi:hypothetical protein
MNNKQSFIFVKFQKEGIHAYPDAAQNPNLKTGDKYDVSFLGFPHRHIFHFKVWIEVRHAERDIEFIQFKRWLEQLYAEGTIDLNYTSCETIAHELNEKITAKYPDRVIWIEVSEDGENGAFLKFNNLSN